MDHYGDDNYDPDLTSGSDGSLLGTTIRNVAVLVAACLALAWSMNEFNNFGSTGATPEFVELRGGGPDTQTGEAAAEVEEPEAPSQQFARGGAEILIPPGPRGHFFVTAAVNGVDVQFLVDTGASTVTLTEDDARRVGLPLGALDYTAVFQTANGEVAAAPVTLRQMRLQGIEVGDVEGTVTRARLPISLLGMSFLSRLAGYEVRGDGMILRD